ncbi:MAG: hypothetical protein OHK0045_03730 [Raineya sp.]
MITLALGANAQDYAFKVMATNGSVRLKNANKRVWAGTALSAADEIVVGANSYIGLMHKGGKTLEIKQAGNYKVSQLNSQVASTNSSNSAKYVSYVAGEMAKADRQDINKNHRKYMAVTGSVERATYSTALAYFLHEPSGKAAEVSLFNPVATIRLYGNPILPNNVANKTFLVRVSDFRNKELFRQEVKANEQGQATVTIDFSKFPYKGDPTFIVESSVKEAKEPEANRARYNVTLLKEGEKYEAMQKAMADFVGETSALSKIVQAGIFEQEGLVLDAATCYEAAIAAEPEVSTFKIAYEDFIARNRMKLLAEKNAEGKPELRPITINPDAKVEEAYKDDANASEAMKPIEDKNAKRNKNKK